MKKGIGCMNIFILIISAAAGIALGIISYYKFGWWQAILWSIGTFIGVVIVGFAALGLAEKLLKK
jgi:hypothetical protein